MMIGKGIYRKDANPMPFLGAMAASGIAYGLYHGVQDNYLVEVLRVTPLERGIIEFFRELPGLLVMAVLAAMYRFSEGKIFKIGTAVMLAGAAGLLLSPAVKWGVVFFIVVFSFGEHTIMPVKSTLSLDLADAGKGGSSLGVTNTLNNLGRIAGYLGVTLLFSLFAKWGYAKGSVVPFKTVYALSAAFMIAAVLISKAMAEPKIKAARRRFYFAPKFGKYYILELFYGARKQIFWTFGPLVLIITYGAPTSLVAFLLGLCALSGMIFSPLVGKLIDRVGYKIVMVLDTLLLVPVCILYGFSRHIFPLDVAIIVVSANYVLDSILSLGNMATNVYVQALSESSEETTATFSTGISVNHVISIVIALTGGIIWKTVGVEALFLLSALLGLLNSLFAATISVASD